MSVTVYGPRAFANEVRNTIRGCVDEGKMVDFYEESFTW